ncbi:putative metal cation transporter [Salinisphaera sp. PC39]|uniref:ZIP family metal transporter n=1 Tax=Salinisphaera sp. PC39 TaxID=1304156 RepID=UPI00333E2ADE
MSTARYWLHWLLPPALLAVAIFAQFKGDWLVELGGAPVPFEDVVVERVVLDEQGIALKYRVDSPDPVTIAQVQVDGAYWRFTQQPEGPLSRGEAAWIRIPYMWVAGDAHHLTLVSSTGATFEHTIEVAQATPQPTPAKFGAWTWVGLYVGLFPVALGMLCYPALRRSGRGIIDFVLAVTLGLLAFLLVDTLLEALEQADQAAGLFQGPLLVLLGATAAFVGLRAVSGGGADGVSLAWRIALGIGLHNLGEGLAIGSAVAAGEIALGTFLVVGFTLHNVTEGIGIAAPLTESRLRLPTWVGLAALAGLPAVAGCWIGAYAFSPQFAALCLALGVGAILQVLIDVGLYLRGRTASAQGLTGQPLLAGGLLTGIAVMYTTALVFSG